VSTTQQYVNVRVSASIYKKFREYLCDRGYMPVTRALDLSMQDSLNSDAYPRWIEESRPIIQRRASASTVEPTPASTIEIPSESSVDDILAQS
jgi:hypothetical protein